MTTPLEMEERIAKIKGLKNPRSWFIEDKYQGICWDIDLVRPSEMTNWAENIEDAWELFEEIPSAILQKVTYSIGSPEKSYAVHYANKGYVYGETAPLAICLAWLAWKGAA